MSQLDLTYNLVPGTNENVNHVQRNFDDVVNWANGGISEDNFLPSTGFLSFWRTIASANALFQVGLIATPNIDNVVHGNLAFGTSGTDFAISGGGASFFYLNPADFAIPGKVTRLRIRAVYMVNSITSGTSVTLGLYQLTGCTSPVNQAVMTFGGPVSGSTFTSGPLVPSTRMTAASPEFSFPPTGNYMFGGQTPGILPNFATTIISFYLQVRWI